MDDPKRMDYLTWIIEGLFGIKRLTFSPTGMIVEAALEKTIILYNAT
jgi:hypothetical protein